MCGYQIQVEEKTADSDLTHGVNLGLIQIDDLIFNTYMM